MRQPTPILPCRKHARQIECRQFCLVALSLANKVSKQGNLLRLFCGGPNLADHFHQTGEAHDGYYTRNQAAPVERASLLDLAPGEASFAQPMR